MKILLVEDHVLVREGLKILLTQKGFQVVAEASDGHEALRLARTTPFDVAVVDIGMPGLNGIDTARELQKASPRSSCILLTRHQEEEFVAAALNAGVKGYVLKDQVVEDLVAAILRVSRGATYLSPGISRAVVDLYRSKGKVSDDPLTYRERQVLQLIGEGKSNKEIASILGLSAKTIESHRSRLMQKLDIHETANLVRYGIRHGLVQA
jgi:DNA-binding NarL/FixJ family response regulator